MDVKTLVNEQIFMTKKFLDVKGRKENAVDYTIEALEKNLLQLREFEKDEYTKKVPKMLVKCARNKRHQIQGKMRLQYLGK